MSRKPQARGPPWGGGTGVMVERKLGRGGKVERWKGNEGRLAEERKGLWGRQAEFRPGLRERASQQQPSVSLLHAHISASPDFCPGRVASGCRCGCGWCAMGVCLRTRAGLVVLCGGPSGGLQLRLLTAGFVLRLLAPLGWSLGLMQGLICEGGDHRPVVNLCASHLNSAASANHMLAAHCWRFGEHKTGHVSFAKVTLKQPINHQPCRCACMAQSCKRHVKLMPGYLVDTPQTWKGCALFLFFILSKSIDQRAQLKKKGNRQSATPTQRKD